MNDATPSPQPPQVQPFAVWNPTRGCGRPASPTSTALGAVLGDLADLRYDARWLGLPASLVGAPHPRFRIFILAHATVPHPVGFRLREGWRDLGAREGATWNHRIEPSGHRLGDEARASAHAGDDLRVDRGVFRRWGRYGPAIARWERITGRPAPAPAIVNEEIGPRPAPAFVEWLMGLPEGWVTDPRLDLSHPQPLAALGNGVLPRQAATCLHVLTAADRGRPA